MASKKIDALKFKDQLRSNFFKTYYSKRELLRKNASQAMNKFINESSKKQPNS